MFVVPFGPILQAITVRTEPVECHGRGKSLGLGLHGLKIEPPQNKRSREIRRLKVPQNILQNERNDERTARKSRENTRHTRKVPNNPWNGQITSETFKFVQRLDSTGRFTVYTEVKRIPRISDCY